MKREIIKILQDGTSGAYKVYHEVNAPYFTIESNNDKSIENLKSWLIKSKVEIAQFVITYGGVYITGFDVKSPEDFNIIALALDPELCNSHDFDDGARMWRTKHIYDASLNSISKDLVPLSFHNEDAFLPIVPRSLMLCCLKPAKEGGETILADGRKVFKSLPIKIQEKFLGRSVKSAFTTPDSTLLVNSRILKNENAILELGKRYRASQVRRIGDFHTHFVFEVPAIIKHENTIEPIWFSRAHQAVPLSQLIDIWHAYRYRRTISSLYKAAIATYKILKEYYQMAIKPRIFAIRNKNTEDSYLSQCTFSDGKPISISDQFKICKAYWKNAAILPLKSGDVIMVDNRLVTHGRLPYYGQRRLYSCIGAQLQIEPYRKVEAI